MRRNFILDTDSYKFAHHRLNPPGTLYKNSYIEARGGAFGYTVFNGLQYYIMSALLSMDLWNDYKEAKDIIDAHMGPGVFNGEQWKRLAEGSGTIPLEIEALPEGTCVPHGTPMVQVRNTDPTMPWLPAYIETAMLRAVWYPSTVATVSREIKAIMKRYLERTADDANVAPHLNFMLHDFGSRGVSSSESAAVGGFAHLINFMGTDTVEALRHARLYYGEPMAGFSIPASEHSVATMFGKDNEAGYVQHMVNTYGGKDKIVAIVGDSYDIFNFVDNVLGEKCKDLVVSNGGRVVVRPDSGEPVSTVLEVLRLLFLRFGSNRNSKGYDVLPPCIRVIQGDGVDANSIDGILSRMETQKISAENIVFGMGGALLQKVDRDTCKFAMKTSAAFTALHVGSIEHKWVEVKKEPVTDKGKVSKSGIFSVGKDEKGRFTIFRELSTTRPKWNLLEPVYRDGKILRTQTLRDIRERAAL